MTIDAMKYSQAERLEPLRGERCASGFAACSRRKCPDTASMSLHSQRCAGTVITRQAGWREHARNLREQQSGTF